MYLEPFLVRAYCLPPFELVYDVISLPSIVCFELLHPMLEVSLSKLAVDFHLCARAGPLLLLVPSTVVEAPEVLPARAQQAACFETVRLEHSVVHQCSRWRRHHG